MKPQPALVGTRPYSVPRSAAPIDRWLDGNEGADPDPALWAAAGGVDALRRYPDARSLEAEIAERVGVDPAQVLVTAGADDALDRICRAMLPGRALLMPTPGFEMLPRYARIAGGTVRTVPWTSERYPTDAVVAAVDSDVAVVAVTSPDNPTGGVASAADLQRVAAAAPEALVLVDLAYGEFADEDLAATALALPNAVVVRTFSKAWGLAGLRVGYAIGPAEVIGWLRTAGAPYAVAGPSLQIATAAWRRGDGPVRAYAQAVRRERARLEDGLCAVGARVSPSQGNFVFARVADAGWWRDGLAGLGLGVRTFPGRPGLEDAVRISVLGDPAVTERVLAAVRAVAAPEAWLFDLDGVLADVSGSYRQAILETAASYGVDLTSADIAAEKAKGNANDDWALTQRMLAARGVDRPLPEVTARFQERYEGGLWRTETLRVPAETVARWAAARPLAIVTGRPRAEALRFLEETGILHHFATVVAREDAAALKPDPAPVQEALKRLGVTAAWMFGDTPDDQRAARAAGVVPVGVLAPGDHDGGTLVAAGAARVATLETLDLLGGRS